MKAPNLTKVIEFTPSPLSDHMVLESLYSVAYPTLPRLSGAIRDVLEGRSEVTEALRPVIDQMLLMFAEGLPALDKEGLTNKKIVRLLTTAELTLSCQARGDRVPVHKLRD